MIYFNKISDIFCLADEFCKDFDKTTRPFVLGVPSRRLPVLSKSEVISICLLFHLSGFVALNISIYLKPVVKF